MKRFQFRFQALLNVEQHKEDAVKQELKTLLYNLQKEKETLSNLQTIYLAQQDELARKQFGWISPVRGSMPYKITPVNHDNLANLETSNGISPEELKLYEAYIFTLSNQITSQQVTVKECEAEADAVRQKLIEISKRRKMLEKLREKKKKEHEYLLQQSENKQLDELAVTRFNHLPFLRGN